MTHKSDRIAERVAGWRGGDLDPRYLGYFDCFNRGLYYEAHEVLEDLWLEDRRGPDGDFYKGLIQLAGAFVHWKKGRLLPCGALLQLATRNLERYPKLHHRLDLEELLQMARDWTSWVASAGPGAQGRDGEAAPRLGLVE
jgi:predicted metal-dependent hydrolase